MKSSPWWKNVDSAAIKDAREEATVDCYDDSEQAMGLFNMVADELQLPTKAVVMGKTVSVTAVQIPPYDSDGLDLVCELDGEEHAMPATHVELLDPLPDGHEFLAAWLDWKSKF